MFWLIVGLVVFFGVHSVRIVADGWRTKFIAEKGQLAWRGVYSIPSLLGLVLIIYGYGLSRADPVFLWSPPPQLRIVTIVLTWFAFLLLAAANIPRNHFKQKLGHPMFLGVKVWAFAHLLSNGRLGDVLLFGCFLVWAIVGYSAARRRDRKEGVVYDQGTLVGSSMVSTAGTIAWVIFAFFLHRMLIGVPPF